MITHLRSKTTTHKTKLRDGFGLIELTVLVIIGLALGALLLPSVRRSGEAARRSQCKNNLKQILWALHNYHDEHNAFPPAYTVDAEGKPLHSWRTLLLPYLEQKPLYDKIDLSKPWNDPANADVVKDAPHVFRCPSSESQPNHTTYLAVVTPGSCLRPAEGRPRSEVVDGEANTVIVIEVPTDQSVPWMAPSDADEALFLSIKLESKLHHTGGVHIGLVDGRVHFLNSTSAAEIRRALISAGGGEPIEGRF